MAAALALYVEWQPRLATHRTNGIRNQKERENNVHAAALNRRQLYVQVAAHRQKGRYEMLAVSNQGDSWNKTSVCNGSFVV